MHQGAGRLSLQDGTRAFGIGQPLGVDSSDSSIRSSPSWRYNVKRVDDDGKLLVDDPKVRPGLIGALKDYTDIYSRGCTPPSATNWKDPDNNVAFHNKTHGATTTRRSRSPPVADDMNNPR